MWRRLLFLVVVALSFVILSPQESWSQRLVDNHDCLKNRKGGFKCVRGPLAGRTFKSDTAMIRALTKGFGPLERTKPVLKNKKRVKKAKSKKARMKKARIKKAKNKKWNKKKRSKKKRSKARKSRRR